LSAATTKPDGIPAGGKEKIVVLFEFVEKSYTKVMIEAV
jgi:hypothetical protein